MGLEYLGFFPQLQNDKHLIRLAKSQTRLSNRRETTKEKGPYEANENGNDELGFFFTVWRERNVGLLHLR